MTRKIHKYIGLSLGAFWLLQVLSGLVIHFRYDIEDRLLGAQAQTVSAQQVGQAIDAASEAGFDPYSIWISGGVEGQLDIYASRGGETYTLRSIPDGEIIRARADSEMLDDGAFWETIKVFHQTLMMGDTGELIVGLSGAFLLFSIAMGVKAGWRGKHQWRSMTKAPAGRISRRPVTLAWHRLLGYWLCLPLFVLVSAGVLQAWHIPLEKLLAGPAAPPPSAAQADEDGSRAPAGPIDAERAVAIALAEFPGARFTAIDLPADAESSYRIKVNTPDEMRRTYGGSEVWVGVDGSVLRKTHASELPASQQFMNALYPVHTGQVFGFTGRLLAFFAGLGMVAILILTIRIVFTRPRQPVRAD
ncbi:PepSY domain-containing protein [Pacificimonas sp. WHA3]|uniref:PepSY domain-containing protein n=1 Tax=Pacificimonas pallii TaxID=2827236 RepID=A0ABS6SA80_9SPHN|nr:PepSY-associated TM helix domain-containing protein [Pacificimonas pallii]MBV7255284.1 PepSY domain-containing protein [Pacificimonas pallii]